MSQALLQSHVPEARIIASVSKFQVADFTTRGAFLVERMSPLWPQVNANNITGHLMPYMGSNQHIFIKNDVAVALGMRMQKPFETAPYVEAVFGFCDGDMKVNGTKLLQLYREMMRWGKELGATEFRPGHVSDLPHGTLKAMLKAEQYGEIIVDLPRG